jgi:hypothetical protein
VSLRSTVVLSVCPHLSVVTDSQTTVHTHLVFVGGGEREGESKGEGGEIGERLIFHGLMSL